MQKGKVIIEKLRDLDAADIPSEFRWEWYFNAPTEHLALFRRTKSVVHAVEELGSYLKEYLKNEIGMRKKRSSILTSHKVRNFFAENARPGLQPAASLNLCL